MSTDSQVKEAHSSHPKQKKNKLKIPFAVRDLMLLVDEDGVIGEG